MSESRNWISPIHYYIHYRICQSKDYVYGLMTPVCLPGLVLTALSCTYFIQRDSNFIGLD